MAAKQALQTPEGKGETKYSQHMHHKLYMRHWLCHQPTYSAQPICKICKTQQINANSHWSQKCTYSCRCGKASFSKRATNSATDVCWQKVSKSSTIVTCQLVHAFILRPNPLLQNQAELTLTWFWDAGASDSCAVTLPFSTMWNRWAKILACIGSPAQKKHQSSIWKAQESPATAVISQKH